MNVRLYSSFSKRKNSTKEPSGSYTDRTCHLKEGTSIERPVIIMSISPAGYSYAYIADFCRYYFIGDVTFNQGVFELSLVNDPMATHKSDIGAYSGLILRTSDTTFYNNKISDPWNQPVEEITHLSDSTQIQISAGNPLFVDGVGTYILTVMGKPSSNYASDNGIARSYALTVSDLKLVADRLLDPTVWQSIINEFTNPMQAIISCVYLPISRSNLTTTNEDLNIGTQTIIDNDGAYLVTDRKVGASGDISYSGAMPLTFANNYQVREPYATYSIYLPFVGMTAIDANILLEGSKLTYSCYVDVFTGDLVYYLKSASGAKIGNYSGNCGTGVPVGSQQIASGLGLAGSVITTIGGAAVGLGTLAAGGGAAALGGLAAFGAGASGMFKSASVHTQVNGSNSSSLGIKGGDSIEVHSFIKNPAFQIEAGASEIGMMCRSFGQIQSHPGFIMMQNASIEIETDVESDIDYINNMLNSGFFYE